VKATGSCIRSRRRNISRFLRVKRRKRACGFWRLLRHNAGARARNGGGSEIAEAGEAPRIGSGGRSERETVASCAARAGEQTLENIQAGKFRLAWKIDPPKGIALDRIYSKWTKSWRPEKWTRLTSTPARWRAWDDALVVAGALEARGVETVPHLTTRDENIIGLQAGLLGAWTVGGVRNVLAITGDPPSVGDYPETSGVYEVDSVAW